jgi:uncharacterized protein DUF3500
MSFDDPERFVWQESPGVRSGVVLRDLNDAQRKLAIALLRTGVGDGGYQRIQMSRARETVLSAQQKTPEGQAVRQPDLSGINTRRVTPLGSPGLPARQMNAQQKALLVALVEEYLTRIPADVAAARRRVLLEGAALDEVSFQWAGGLEPGHAHAYIVQGPTFLIEYAQNRNNAVGHVHTLWRDFTGDFGGEILGTR